MPLRQVNRLKHRFIHILRAVFGLHGVLALPTIIILALVFQGPTLALCVVVLWSLCLWVPGLVNKRYGRIWRGLLLPNFSALAQNEALELELERAMQNYLSGRVNAACFTVQNGFDLLALQSVLTAA